MKKAEIKKLRDLLGQYRSELLSLAVEQSPPNDDLVRLSNKMNDAMLYVQEAEYVIKNLK